MSCRVTLGASSDSPPATTRIPSSSWAGGVSLSRKPLAPARSAPKTYSSRSNVVSTSTRVPTPSRGDRAGRLEPVHDRHADVHEHDVGLELAHQRHRLGAVLALADDLEVWGGVHEQAERPAHERLVVHHDDPHRRAHGDPAAYGSVRVTRNPPPGRGPASKLPP